MAKFDPVFPWVIHKDGVGGTCSRVPYCGYSLETLKSMAQAGYFLFYQGKKVKLSGLTGAMIQKVRC